MQNTFKLAVGVCCCLQICNSVVNMVVKGLVLGQSLMVVSTLLSVQHGHLTLQSFLLLSLIAKNDIEY